MAKKGWLCGSVRVHVYVRVSTSFTAPPGGTRLALSVAAGRALAVGGNHPAAVCVQVVRVCACVNMLCE